MQLGQEDLNLGSLINRAVGSLVIHSSITLSEFEKELLKFDPGSVLGSLKSDALKGDKQHDSHLLSIKGLALLTVCGSLDLHFRKILKEKKVSFQAKGQGAHYLLVDLWGRRLGAERLFLMLTSDGLYRGADREWRLNALKSGLLDILTGYQEFASRAGLQGDGSGALIEESLNQLVY